MHATLNVSSYIKLIGVKFNCGYRPHNGCEINAHWGTLAIYNDLSAADNLQWT